MSRRPEQAPVPRWEWHAHGCRCSSCDPALARTTVVADRAASIAIASGVVYIAARVLAHA